jgi:CheY-like chemotaxis protein
MIVIADRARLAQVISNLLNNAAKYTDPGGTISVTAEAQNGLAVLRVRDSGCGMSPELLSRAFALFEQGPQSLARPEGGLGLGLAIVKNIVTLHGGTVVAMSEGVGKGSELVVRLPIATADEMPAMTRPQRAPSVARHRRVLIVDDNRDAAEMLQLGLQVLGHCVFATYDGPSALALLEEAAPDVILLDIGLPGMDGYELARRIRLVDGNQAPMLVAISGYGGETDQDRTRAAGFAHHLVKPIQLEAIVELIAKLPGG